MNRVMIGSAALVVALSLTAPAHADPTVDPVPPAPATSVPEAGPLPGPAPVPAEPDAAAADPAGPADPEAVGLSPVGDTGNPVHDACEQFFQAGNLAATTYEDFADASEGASNTVNYGDPEVQRTALISRAALRTAAGAALDAANTPGLPPEVADPMRSWSMHATKLIFVVGLHAGRETMNNAVNQVNIDYGNARQACALAMVNRG